MGARSRTNVWLTPPEVSGGSRNRSCPTSACQTMNYLCFLSLLLPLFCLVIALGLLGDPLPMQRSPAWPHWCLHSADVHLSLPSVVSPAPRASYCSSSLFPSGLCVPHQGFLLICYPQPHKPGFHLQSLDNRDISTAVSFWQSPILPFFFFSITYFS